MRTLIRLLLLVVFSAAAANAQITSYTTNFPLTENRISEEGAGSMVLRLGLTGTTFLQRLDLLVA